MTDEEIWNSAYNAAPAMENRTLFADQALKDHRKRFPKEDVGKPFGRPSDGKEAASKADELNEIVAELKEKWDVPLVNQEPDTEKESEFLGLYLHKNDTVEGAIERDRSSGKIWHSTKGWVPLPENKAPHGYSYMHQSDVCKEPETVEIDGKEYPKIIEGPPRGWVERDLDAEKAERIQKEIAQGLPAKMGAWHREQLEKEFGRGHSLDELLAMARKKRENGD